MMRLSNLTYRNLLIAIHDVLATTLAVLTSFYLRFEGEQFFERLPLLLHLLPYFVAFSIVVCYAFNLTTTKWRFISLPDALNILRAASVLTVALLVMDYIFVAPNVRGTFFLGKIPRGVLFERLALCLPLFPVHPRTSSGPNRGYVTDPLDRTRC
jgi:O-antigen biosynthesis protein WbqV